MCVDTRRNQEEQNEHDQRAREREQNVHVRSLQHLFADVAQNRLEFVNVELESDICDAHEAFDNRVEQNHRGRNAHDSEDHTEELAERSLRVDIAVTDRREDRAAEEHGLAEGPVGLLGDVANGRHAVIVCDAHHLDESIEFVVGETLVVALTKLTHELVEIANDARFMRRLESVKDQRAEEQVEDVDQNEERQALVGRLKQSRQHFWLSEKKVFTYL